MQKIRVKIKGYDHKVVDKTIEAICKNVVDTGARVRGPVPLPNKRWMMALHRGPHIDAKSKEHIGMIEHTRLIDILEANAKTIESLTHMQLPAGVEIKIS